MQFFARMLTAPLRRLPLTFLMLFALGILTAWLTLPGTRGARLYEHLWSELFVDVYVLVALIALLPKTLRRWTALAVSVFAYAVAIVDVYCFVKYQSTLTPTMLLLVGETNGREAAEFIGTCLSVDTILSPVGWVLLLAAVHIAAALSLITLDKSRSFSMILDSYRGLSRVIEGYQWLLEVAGALLILLLLALSVPKAWPNKQATWRLLTAPNIGTVEHILTEKEHANLYQPAWRLAFSIYANTLTARQIDKLIEAKDCVEVDSVAYRSKHIVLIIGESFSRHHSQQYGYFQPTTPRQLEREKKGSLVKFSDVVSPWNLTSFVFKYLFSMQSVGDEGEWCDYPLFPELFRAAGYHVNFLTNQFLPQAKEAVYDFSGGFFLNNPTMSEAMFNTRNTSLHRFDDGLLEDYDSLRYSNTEHNLTIFHLGGMHVQYKLRAPNDRKPFYGDMYKERKPHLNPRERRILADYDNAILYNDSIVDQIISRFEDEEAVVLYVPDHGEECYEDSLHFYCRMHSAKIDRRLAHAEFDIPFWIWCSHRYTESHPDICKQIVDARDRRYMTDRLPHLLLYLAGISTKEYREELNILSPDYDEQRPRILKLTADYDNLE